MATNDNIGVSEFTLSYEGVATSDNSIDVKDLAPGLIALGEVFERSNVVLNGNRASASLRIQATNSGSFELLLAIHQAYAGGLGVLTSNLFTAAANLQTVIVGTPQVLGLLGVFKKLKGQTPVIEQKHNGIYFKASNVELAVSEDVTKIFQDKTVQRLMPLVVEPLTRSGIESMVFKEGRGTKRRLLETVAKSDVPSFTLTDGNDSVNETEIPRQILTITKASFNEGAWYLHDGNHNDWYAIEDKNFNASIKQGARRFGAGDLLVCRVKLIQTLTPDGRFETTRVIPSIMEHRVLGRQIRMIDDDK